MKQAKRIKNNSLPLWQVRLPFLALFAVIFLLYATVSVRIEDDAWFASVFELHPNC